MGSNDRCGQVLMVEESEVPSGGVGGMRGKRRELTFITYSVPGWSCYKMDSSTS